MPGEVTDWGAAQYLAILHGLADVPGGYWVALCTDEPGTGTDGDLLAELEPQDPVYHRVFLPKGVDTWSDPDQGGYTANLTAVDFGVPGADWGLINYFALCDSQSSGHVYAYGEFVQPVFVSSDFDALIPVGGITVQLASQTPPIVSF